MHLYADLVGLKKRQWFTGAYVVCTTHVSCLRVAGGRDHLSNLFFYRYVGHNGRELERLACMVASSSCNAKYGRYYGGLWVSKRVDEGVLTIDVGTSRVLEWVRPSATGRACAVANFSSSKQQQPQQDPRLLLQIIHWLSAKDRFTIVRIPG